MSTLGIKYEVFVGEDKKFVVFRKGKLYTEDAKQCNFISTQKTIFRTGLKRFWTSQKTHYWDVKAWVEVWLTLEDL